MPFGTGLNLAEIDSRPEWHQLKLEVVAWQVVGEAGIVAVSAVGIVWDGA